MRDLDAADRLKNSPGSSPAAAAPVTGLAGRWQLIVVLAVAVIAAAQLGGTWVIVQELRKPVTVTSIDQVVQVAAPQHADLYGFCRRNGTGAYLVEIDALAGGIVQTVAAGNYAEGAASAIGLYAAAYYLSGSALDFGEASAECSHLPGWE